jgi:magnesium transporter
MSGRPRSFYLPPSGPLRTGLDRDALAAALAAGEGQLWVDIDSRREEEWLLLSELFGFHPLSVEDTRSPQGRIKLEEYDGYLFVVARDVSFASLTPEPYDIETSSLHLFLGKHYLVTVCGRTLRSVETLVERVQSHPDLLKRGVDHMAYQILDTMVDLYFPLLDELDGFVDELEEEAFRGGGPQLMGRITDLKRTVFALRRHMAATREVTSSLSSRPIALLRPETQLYFRDVYDHVVRQVESVEAYRDLIAGVLEIHLSGLSNRMNQVMKTLSIVATLVLPPSLLAGIYGMNFVRMPGLENPVGFWLAVAGMFLISGGFLVYAWWKRWL